MSVRAPHPPPDSEPGAVSPPVSVQTPLPGSECRERNIRSEVGQYRAEAGSGKGQSGEKISREGRGSGKEYG